nr:IS21 family transposase [Lysobacter sp.]
MRKLRGVMRLHAAGLTGRQIAQSAGMARSTVAERLRRVGDAGLAWPLPESLTETTLEQRLYPATAPACDPRPAPDWTGVHRELRRKGVTLQLLWEEYREQHPAGYRYSRFCDLYRQWQRRIDVVMRQEHRAGEKLFVDYAGQTVPIVDRQTGEIRRVQIFVAVLGASSYCFAEATWTQGLPDWLGSHVRVLEWLDGCPAIVVPDNLRSGVCRPHHYEPDINPGYQALADHYGMAVVPARVRKPCDKAKAEAWVLLVERWILACLRQQTFFCLDQLNREIARRLGPPNNRAFRKLPGSRRSTFEQLDQPALRPLPAQRYKFAQWKKARVGIDYHVEFDGHYYSAPYALARQAVELRVTASVLEVLHRGQRVASHVRSPRRGGHTTVTAHMPVAHQQQREWTPERLTSWAHKSGPA